MAKFIAIEEVAIKNMSNWNTEKPPPPVPTVWTSFAPLLLGITLESKDADIFPKVAKKKPIQMEPIDRGENCPSQLLEVWDLSGTELKCTSYHSSPATRLKWMNACWKIADIKHVRSFRSHLVFFAALLR